MSKYLTVSKKIKQSWVRPENFDICFYASFELDCQKLTSEAEAGHSHVSPPTFEISDLWKDCMNILDFLYGDIHQGKVASETTTFDWLCPSTCPAMLNFA